MTAASDIVLLSERLGAPTSEDRRIESEGLGTLKAAPLWTIDDIRAHGADAAAIILGAVEPFDATALAELPKCRAIIRRGVGYDNVDTTAATALGIVVANVVDASVEEVSDHAMALLFAIERRIGPLDTAVRTGLWRHDPTAIAAIREGIRRISELTLGIVGFGRIGQALARKALGTYGTILAADPYTSPEVAESAGVRLIDLDGLLERSDHISVHAPLGPGTRHLLDAGAFLRLREGAVVVNTSRGGLIDEAALIDALRSGRLAGAGIDVSEREPLPIDDPLMTAPRVLLTGHSALASSTAQVELARRSVDATIALLAGRPPASIVNQAVLASPELRIPELANQVPGGS